MKTSVKGKNIIKEFEELRLTAYLCPRNVPTIGWGTIVYPNGKKVALGDKCTIEQAEIYLSSFLDNAEVQITKAIKTPISQEMFDALVCLTYNIGVEAFLTSTILKKINACDYVGAAEEFPRWNKSGGKTLPGLIRRRALERTLFLEGVKKLT